MESETSTAAAVAKPITNAQTVCNEINAKRALQRFPEADQDRGRECEAPPPR